MEKQLFDWEGGVDQVDDAAWIFYTCTLKVQIGSLPIGTIVESITIDFSTGELQINDEKERHQLEVRIK